MSTLKVDKLQGTSGAVTGLTFSGANGTFGGTLAVTGVHTVGSNAVATSEGGAVTQNVTQSLVKAWVHAHQHDAQDSFNVASQTDTGTGDYTFTFTNSFGSDEFATASSNQSTSNGQGLYVGNFATSSFRINPTNASGTSTDYNTSTVIAGDLA
jgi:hypothetical protein